MPHTAEEIDQYLSVLAQLDASTAAPKKLYIQEHNSKLNELALYGPFGEDEIEERLNDAFADLMASGLANIDAVSLTDEEASKFYINPREFWMEQLATHTE